MAGNAFLPGKSLPQQPLGQVHPWFWSLQPAILVGGFSPVRGAGSTLLGPFFPLVDGPSGTQSAQLLVLMQL